ncbi:MAG: type II pantothenate kinase [Clostridia bacterium]|nr:type II pantothenate kinase [Clostridia bacterium]
MSYIVGIDVGGSTTKIVAFDHNKKIVAPMFVTAEDQMTSIYGAFGKFTSMNGISLADVDRIMITGVGSTFIGNELYGIECEHVSEFQAVGIGGQYLSGLERALVVSMGTGTASVYANGKSRTYIGGTGVGGGTIIGLSKKMLGVGDMKTLCELAEEGDLGNIDLRIGDITNKSISPTLQDSTTAANFGNLSDLANNSDIALGILNLVFETVGMIAVFASRSCEIRDIVLTGTLTRAPQAKPIFDKMSSMFDVNFIIPDHSRYGTVIGAALSYFEKQ